MKVNRVSSGVYRVWYAGIEGLAVLAGKGIMLSPSLRAAGLGMRSLRDLIAGADRTADRMERLKRSE